MRNPAASRMRRVRSSARSAAVRRTACSASSAATSRCPRFAASSAVASRVEATPSSGSKRPPGEVQCMLLAVGDKRGQEPVHVSSLGIRGVPVDERSEQWVREPNALAVDLEHAGAERPLRRRRARSRPPAAARASAVPVRRRGGGCSGRRPKARRGAPASPRRASSGLAGPRRVAAILAARAPRRAGARRRDSLPRSGTEPAKSAARNSRAGVTGRPLRARPARVPRAVAG